MIKGDLSFPERLSQIITELGYINNKAAFARKLSESGKKIQPSNITRYLQGEYKPKEEFFTQFEIAFPQYNLTWIRNGTGPLLKKDILAQEGNTEVPDSGVITISDNAEIYTNKPDKEWQMNVSYYTRLQEANTRLKLAQEQVKKATDEIDAILAEGVTLTTKKRIKELSSN